MLGRRTGVARYILLMTTKRTKGAAWRGVGPSLSGIGPIEASSAFPERWRVLRGW